MTDHEYSYRTDTSTIAVAKAKGGVGSSMTAMMLAFEYALRGAEVLVIDGDPVSRTATRWFANALAEDPDADAPIRVHTYEPMYGTLPEVAVLLGRQHQLDLVIFDLAADSNRVMEAAPLADVLIGPTGPTLDEYSPCTDLHVKVRGSHRDKPWLTVLTRIPAEGRGAAALARQVLEADAVPVAATEIRRNAPLYSDRSGTFPTDTAQYAALADEINPFLKRAWEAAR